MCVWCLYRNKIYHVFIFFPDDCIENSVKSTQTNDVEERGRTSHPKHQDTERARSLSSQATFDPIHSRLSKSNENINQTLPLKTPSPNNELQRGERITKSEDRHLTNKSLTNAQIQQYKVLREKFERQQPIDVVFGINISMLFLYFNLLLSLDPRRYPFKVLLQHPYPIVNLDVHLLSMFFL